MFKRIAVFILSILIVTQSTFALSTPDWELEKIYTNAKKGASVDLLARNKNNANLVSKITKSPTTKAMSKVLRVGGGGVVLALAVYELFGAVDWVLDPENNAIKIKKTITNDDQCTTYGYDGYASKDEILQYNLDHQPSKFAFETKEIVKFATTESVIKYNQVMYSESHDIERTTQFACLYEKEETEELVPLDKISQKIKTMADDGNTEAQDFVKEVVTQTAVEGGYDSDFDANAKEETTEPDPETGCQDGYKLEGDVCVLDPDAETDTETDPESETPTDFELPPFCEYAEKLCDWLGWTREAHQTTTEQIEEQIEQVDNVTVETIDGDAIRTSNPELNEKLDTQIEQTASVTETSEDGEKSIRVTVGDDNHSYSDNPDLPEKDIQLKDPSEFDKPYMQAPNECPPDVVASVPVGSISHTLTFPMAPICSFGSTYIKPVINFIALILTALSIASIFKVG